MAGFKGGFGGFGGGNMQQLMRQAQKMQQEMQKAQEELEEAEVEGESANGLIKVTMTGKKIVTGINISKEVVDVDDLEMLEDLIIVALNDGYKKADELSKEKLGDFGNAGGLL